MTMITPEDIKKIMGRRAKTVCPNVLEERPRATTEELGSFIVVLLPYSPVNRLLSEVGDWWMDMTVVFDIYAKDIVTAKFPNRPDSDTLESLRTGVLGLFPIVDREVGLKIVRPRVVVNSASVDDDYHYTRVQAKLTTMI